MLFLSFYYNPVLESQQQNHLVFRCQSALPERGGAVWRHPLEKRKKQNCLENITSINYLSSATLHCYMHPLPEQTLEHLQTTAKQWATQSRANSSAPWSSSSAAISQLRHFISLVHNMPCNLLFLAKTLSCNIFASSLLFFNTYWKNSQVLEELFQSFKGL